MESETLINLAWLLIGGVLFFFAMRYIAGRYARTQDDLGPLLANGQPSNGRSPAALRDPVCGMGVEPSEDISWIHDGRTYYFCSMSCRGRFRNAPEKFLVPRELVDYRDA